GEGWSAPLRLPGLDSRRRGQDAPVGPLNSPPPRAAGPPRGTTPPSGCSLFLLPPPHPHQPPQPQLLGVAQGAAGARPLKRRRLQEPRPPPARRSHEGLGWSPRRGPQRGGPGGRGGWQPEAVIRAHVIRAHLPRGHVGNALVLAVLLHRGQAVTTTNLFILNLGVADLCFILCCEPFQATIYTLDGWAVHFLIFLIMHASSFTLAAVSLDRYLVIRYPLHSQELRTPRAALAAIGLIWGLSLLLSGPYLSYYRQSQLANLTVCHPVWSGPHRRAMDLCAFVFSYLLPLLVLDLTYARTLHYLWRAVGPGTLGAGTRRAKHKVTRMLVIVDVLFCLCWMPHHALILCVWFGHFPLTHATYVLRIFSHLLAYANSCVNPIVYALVSKHFRKGFRRICAGLLRPAPRRASGHLCVAAQGPHGGSRLELESTDLTHVSEGARACGGASQPPSVEPGAGVLEEATDPGSSCALRGSVWA
ncbi:Galanin receptor type 2, partial [Galemys pyrenaicus]